MEKKNKINMLSPEEMQKETSQSPRADWWDWDNSGTDSGTIPTDPHEACEYPKKFGDHCKWYEERTGLHYGLCHYDYNLPKLTLVCEESPGGSGTEEF